MKKTDLDATVVVDANVTIKAEEIITTESDVTFKTDGVIPLDTNVTLKTDGTIPVDASVTINTDGSIPIEIVNTPVGWQEIILNNLPFLITILIVATAATVTYLSNRKSVASQNEIANKARIEEHENKISEFRHHWIQEVRETVSLLCQILYELQFHITQRNIARGNEREAMKNNDEEAGAGFEKSANESYKQLIKKRVQYYRVSTKLKLLFKKDEPSTVLVFDIINDMNNEVYDFDKTKLEESKIDEIVSSFQEVLKSEWEVTKERSWQKNT